MGKDFWRWHSRKEYIHAAPGTAFFHEREVWWCTIGTNIGFEQDGGKRFERPVVIVKKYNLDAALIIPLTGRTKRGKYYFQIGKIEGRDATAILLQLRFIDRKRLTNKICTLPVRTFEPLIRSIVSVNFQS